MKYIIVLGDGMADEPLPELSGKTPLEAVDAKTLKMLAAKSEIGMVQTIPDGMKPGSDTANLSVIGYDPTVYYSGRSPLEALSIGVPMAERDVALRCNFVTLSEEDTAFEKKTILDHSAGEISTEDCTVLLEAVRNELEDDTYRFFAGTSYRHCLIWKQGLVEELTPPHDVLEQVIGRFLPEDRNLRRMMEASYRILVSHPINLERKRRGLNPANCCWFWGAGTRPRLTSFEERTGKKGVMISAVDLLKGIAVGAGMHVVQVEGADGGLHTNYEGKMQAAVDALLKEGFDFAYIHVEAPDEMSHQGSVERKLQAIEYLDSRVIGPLYHKMKESGERFRLLVLPDHPTPVRLRTHTNGDVPYLLYDSEHELEGSLRYNEREAAAGGNRVSKGYTLIDKVIDKTGKD